MSDEQLQCVRGFSVRAPGGCIEWEGACDLRGLDLDRIVHIGERNVVVDISSSSSHPDTRDKRCDQAGHSLNKPALVTLHRVLPRAGMDMDRFAEKIRRACVTDGAELVRFDKSTGVWQFRVTHF